MKVRLVDEAEAELKSAAQWYEDRQAGLGARFLDEAVTAFREIEKHPQQFARVTYRTARHIRRRMFDHFPQFRGLRNQIRSVRSARDRPREAKTWVLAVTELMNACRVRNAHCETMQPRASIL